MEVKKTMIIGTYEPLDTTLLFGMFLGFYIVGKMSAIVSKAMTLVRGGMD